MNEISRNDFSTIDRRLSNSTLHSGKGKSHWSMTFRPGKRLRITSGARLNLAKLALALFVSAAGGCVMVGTQYTPPTQQQLAAVGYGAPLTVDYKKAIQTLFLDQLKDPLSAQYIYDSDVPKKWWTQDYIGGALHIGYAVTFRMNSKNSYGAYIGFRKWLILFRDNQIVAVTYDGNSWSEWFYTGSVKEGLHYGSLKADESELQWHQSYHGAEFPWPNVS
jgi:hypothetical protein